MQRNHLKIIANSKFHEHEKELFNKHIWSKISKLFLDLIDRR